LANIETPIQDILNSHLTSITGLSAQSTILSAGTLIKRISKTLTTAVSAITLSTGDDGNVLSGKFSSLRIMVPAGCSAAAGTSSITAMQINSVNSNSYRDQFSQATLNNQIFIGGIRNQYGNIWCDMSVLASTALVIRGHYSYSDNTTMAYNTISGAMPVLGSTKISTVYFYSSGSYTFPVGTVIEYWEVPA